MGLQSVRSFDFTIWHEPLCDVLLPAEKDGGCKLLSIHAKKISLKACSKELRKKQQTLNKLRLLWHDQVSIKIHRLVLFGKVCFA